MALDRSFHISNVSPVVDGKPTRVRFVTKADGSKVRVAARDGSELGVVHGPRDRGAKPAGPKPARAKKPAAAPKAAAVKPAAKKPGGASGKSRVSARKSAGKSGA